MKSHEFTKEAGIAPITPIQPVATNKNTAAEVPQADTTGIAGAIDKAKTQLAQPGLASKAATALGRGVVAGTTGAFKGAAGILGNLNKGMSGGGVQGFHNAGSSDKGGTAARGPVSFDPEKVDPKVTAYIKQAAGGQKLRQPTNNQGLDVILKNAGLL